MNGEATAVANVDQARGWDGPDGENWTDNEEVYNQAVRYLTPRLLEAAAIGPEDRILDIGCGCGESTRLAAAAAVSGSAFGIDLSSRMIERARERAEGEGHNNVRFERGDAQVYPFKRRSFDVGLSRYGATFFNDAAAAYTNIARALKPGGRLVLLCWRELRANEWVIALRDAFAAGRTLPEPPPHTASPFAFADASWAGRVLEGAGFDGATFETVDEPVYFGRDADESYASIMRLGIATANLKDLDARGSVRALEALRSTVRDHETADGVLFGSSSWLVRATKAREPKGGRS